MKKNYEAPKADVLDLKNQIQTVIGDSLTESVKLDDDDEMDE